MCPTSVTSPLVPNDQNVDISSINEVNTIIIENRDPVQQVFRRDIFEVVVLFSCEAIHTYKTQVQLDATANCTTLLSVDYNFLT